MGKRDEWAVIHEKLEEAGYKVRLMSSGHYGVFTATGARVYTLCFTPSDKRSYLNACSNIRRILGVEVRNRRRK